MSSKSFTLLLILASTLPTALQVARAQQARPSVDTELEQKGFSNISEAGKLFTVSMDPKETLFQVKVSGIEAARVDFNTTEVIAEYGIGENKKTVVLRKVTDSAGETYFTLEKSNYKNLKFNIKSGNNSETIPMEEMK